MGDVSKRLSRSEFACKCGCGFAAVDCELLDVLEDVADWFQRKHVANRCRIIITSGCRCVEHNEHVHKKIHPKYKPYSSKSKHVHGMAADFYLDIQRQDHKFKVDPGKVARYLVDQYPGRYGIGRGYTSFTHIDVRQKAARW